MTIIDAKGGPCRWLRGGARDQVLLSLLAVALFLIELGGFFRNLANTALKYRMIAAEFDQQPLRPAGATA